MCCSFKLESITVKHTEVLVSTISTFSYRKAIFEASHDQSVGLLSLKPEQSDGVEFQKQSWHSLRTQPAPLWHGGAGSLLQVPLAASGSGSKAVVPVGTSFIDTLFL